MSKDLTCQIIIITYRMTEQLTVDSRCCLWVEQQKSCEGINFFHHAPQISNRLNVRRTYCEKIHRNRCANLWANGSGVVSVGFQCEKRRTVFQLSFSTKYYTIDFKYACYTLCVMNSVIYAVESQRRHVSLIRSINPCNQRTTLYSRSAENSGILDYQCNAIYYNTGCKTS